jgi:signal transduction histidine kinase
VLSIVRNTVHLSAFTKTTPSADAELTAWFPRELSALPYGDHIRRGEIFRLPDTEADPVLRDIARSRGYRSIVFVPLLHDGFAIGMIGQTKSESGPFAENHVELLKTFADQAVIAISNVRLFQEVQKRTRELSTSLDDLRFAQDRLVQTEKLAALGRLVAGVAHEINTPIGTSLTVASTLESKRAAFATEAARETLRRSTLTEFLEASREASLQLVATDQNYTVPRVFDLGELTEQIAKSLRPGLRKRSVTFNVTCQPNLVFNSHPGPYGQVLTNLFLNATAHAFPDATSGTISINVQAAGDDAAEVLFSDDGCGMTSDVRRKAFDPFFTTSRDQGNAGLGLHIVHSIVTTCLGGTLDLDSEPGKGTKIKLRLPLVAPVGAAPEAH